MPAMMTIGELVKLLDHAAFEAQNMLDVSTEALMETTKLLAQSFIGHENPEWPELKESTVEEKTRLGYVGQISATDPLLRTGELRESIHAVAFIDPIGATGIVGSDDPVALYQEMGTVHIPPRSFLGMAMMECYPAADRIFGEYAVGLLMGKTTTRLPPTP